MFALACSRHALTRLKGLAALQASETDAALCNAVSAALRDPL
jgi:hypothetical protein